MPRLLSCPNTRRFGHWFQPHLFHICLGLANVTAKWFRLTFDVDHMKFYSPLRYMKIPGFPTSLTSGILSTASQCPRMYQHRAPVRDELWRRFNETKMWRCEREQRRYEKWMKQLEAPGLRSLVEDVWGFHKWLSMAKRSPRRQSHSAKMAKLFAKVKKCSTFRIFSSFSTFRA